jgi:putative membrane protein
VAQLEADATRRTVLANERTALAWWRTGLTSLAVALAVGRIVPELGDASRSWPYTVVGIGFALYGVALIVYGTRRSREVMRALERDDPILPPDDAIGLMTAAGAVLALLTAVLILVD